MRDPAVDEIRQVPRAIMSNHQIWLDMLVVRLYADAAAIRAQWSNPSATQTRHFVLDGLVTYPDLIRDAHEAFLSEAARFTTQETIWQRRKTCSWHTGCNHLLVGLGNAFGDGRFAAVLSYLLDLDPLDAGQDADGDDMTIMTRGDFLNPCIDSSHNGGGSKTRRLKLFYFLSPDWTVRDGGILEFWDRQIASATTIVPAADRLVVMETSETSWHSLSTVMADQDLCFVTKFYFSATSRGRDKVHAATFSGRPGERGKRILGYTGGAIRNLVSRL